MALLRFRYPLSLPLSSLSSSSPAHGWRRLRCAAGNQALFSVDAKKVFPSLPPLSHLPFIAI
ncbi:hypothetical protein B296_00045158 [Ensete ventricosum]|uniref:Uncharacterized protein n=1 Tax=Ensete ventricosum TaxID=4639 RepID=A0A426YZR1_ENSVE|nr:hypothetical protein B296_00045158 [Ensete ventricosum]